MKLSETDLRGCYRAWHESAGVFRSFVRATAFSSLQHHEDFEYEVTLEDGFADEIWQRVLAEEKRVLLLVDLPGVDSLMTGVSLHRKHGCVPVLISNGFMHDHGIIGDLAYKEAILGLAGELGSVARGPAVFLLDHGRYGEFEQEELVHSFNNQYELNEEDLPSAIMLQELGCEKVLIFSVLPLKEDLEAYVGYLRESGTEVGISELENK